MPALAIQSDSDLLTALLDPSFSLDDLALGAGIDLAGLLERLQAPAILEALESLERTLALRLRILAAARAR